MPRRFNSSTWRSRSVFTRRGHSNVFQLNLKLILIPDASLCKPPLEVMALEGSKTHKAKHFRRLVENSVQKIYEENQEQLSLDMAFILQKQTHVYAWR